MRWVVLTLALLVAAPVSAQITITPASAVNGGGVITTPLLAATTPTDCSAPGYSFQGDTNTGIGYSAADQVSLCAGGTAGYFNNARFGIYGDLAFSSSSDVILTKDGASDVLAQRRSTNAQRLNIYNTYTSSSNNEVFSVDWKTTANTALVGTRTAATGTARAMQLGVEGNNAVDVYIAFKFQAAPPFFDAGLVNAAGTFAQPTTATDNMIQLGDITSNLTSGGSFVDVAIIPTYNQASGAENNTDLLINRTQTAVGSGTQLLFDAQVGGTSMFKVTNGNQVGIGLGASAPSATLSLVGNGSFNFLARTYMTSPADGQLNINNNAVSSGIGLDVTTDGALAIRNRAQNAYGALLADNITATGATITQGSGTGVTVNNTGRLQRLVYKVTVDRTNCIAAAVTCDVTIATLPAKAALLAVYANLTTTYACASTCTTSTLSITLGTAAGGNQVLLSFDADAATGVFGDADAELGADLTRATAVQGGKVYSFSATQILSMRVTSGTGNLGTGAATNLSQGSVTFYIVTELMP